MKRVLCSEYSRNMARGRGGKYRKGRKKDSRNWAKKLQARAAGKR